MIIYFAFILIVFSVFSRLIPHAPNFTPVISVALFAAVNLKKPLAFAVPIAALLVSDAIIGFYGPLMFFVYGSMTLITILGFMMRGDATVKKVFWFSIGGALLFFVVTNFGVWVLPNSVYPKSLAGLVECYVMAIPFFRNTLLGALVYSGALFGIYELAGKYMAERKIA